MATNTWTDAQFDQMSWHDNHVHALRLEEGAYGAGVLSLDLDYIVEWVKTPEGIRFRIEPSTLRFFDVAALLITLDYATPGAGVGPFSIHGITRRTEARERYVATLWTIEVNWPTGELSFEASRFEQTGWGEIVLSAEQRLAPAERLRRTD